MTIADQKLLLEAIQAALDGQWHLAHDIVQAHEGRYLFDRIHAALHRQEGDEWNARWWYNQLNEPYPTVSIEEELKSLQNQLSHE